MFSGLLSDEDVGGGPVIEIMNCGGDAESSVASLVGGFLEGGGPPIGKLLNMLNFDAMDVLALGEAVFVLPKTGGVDVVEVGEGELLGTTATVFLWTGVLTGVSSFG